MAHFVELDENNYVIRGVVVNNDVITQDGIEVEQIGIDFLKELYGENTNWKQTSYNRSFRKNYAYPGCYYDTDWDAFRTPQPYPSWKLNYETFTWEPPIPKPEYQDGYVHRWSEVNKEWIRFSMQTGGKE